jgi:ankyrin repeat protein
MELTMGITDLNMEVNELARGIDRGDVRLVFRAINDGADVNKLDDFSGTPYLIRSLRIGQQLDIIRALIIAGADVNTKIWKDLSPLFLAITGGYTETVRELIAAGADVNLKCDWQLSGMVWGELTNYTESHQPKTKGGITVVKHVKGRHPHSFVSTTSPLYWAMVTGRAEVVRELINVGADFNTEERDTLFDNLKEGYFEKLQFLKYLEPCLISELYDSGLLHIPISLGDLITTKLVLSCRGVDVNAKDALGRAPIHCAIETGNEVIINELLSAGCDLSVLDDSGRSVQHLAAIYGHDNLTETFIEKGLDPNQTDNCGRNSLHYGVMYRNEDTVRLLLQHGVDPNKRDCNDKIPMDYVHRCEKDTLIYKELQHEPLDITVISLTDDHSNWPDIPCRCNLADLAGQPGVGSVKNIEGFIVSEFIHFVQEMVEEVIGEALPSGCGEVIGCGSSFEGSKVGLPDELDFLIRISEIYTTEAGGVEGHINDLMFREFAMAGQWGITHGTWLWDKLNIYWKKHYGNVVGGRFTMPLPPRRHPERKTCTTWTWLYSDEIFRDLPISIDFVSAVRYESRSIGARRTWLKTAVAMWASKQKSCYVVPKLPHECSPMSKGFNPGELNTGGRFFFPTLEVEHLVNLDQRLADVFITAKCLRKPEVCGFRIKDEKGRVLNAGEFITSYRLKTVFLHLVPEFLKSKLSLGAMVLMVFEQLEKYLEEGRLPSFFDEPHVNVLAASRLSAKDSLRVARLMKGLVRSICERDFQ